MPIEVEDDIIFFHFFFMATFEGQGLHTRSNDRGTKAYHDFYGMY